MRIDIFNVGHGQCVTLTAPNGRRMMLAPTGYRPGLRV
jgi:hypothetical protein